MQFGCTTRANLGDSWSGITLECDEYNMSVVQVGCMNWPAERFDIHRNIVSHVQIQDVEERSILALEKVSARRYYYLNFKVNF